MQPLMLMDSQVSSYIIIFNLFYSRRSSNRSSRTSST